MASCKTDFLCTLPRRSFLMRFGSPDWECAFLYSLLHYIPERWSLKIKCGPWKVLEKSLKHPAMSGMVNYFPPYPKIILNLWIILWPYRISQQAFSPKDLCLACYHFKGCQHTLTTGAVAAYFEVFAGCKSSICKSQVLKGLVHDNAHVWVLIVFQPIGSELDARK